MKNKILFISLFIAGAINHLFANPSDTITLNLSQSLNPATFTFDPQKGYWTETYNDEDYTFIDFEHFSFSHLIAGIFTKFVPLTLSVMFCSIYLFCMEPITRIVMARSKT